jgi:hypothetical protein
VCASFWLTLLARAVAYDVRALISATGPIQKIGSTLENGDSEVGEPAVQSVREILGHGVCITGFAARL